MRLEVDLLYKLFYDEEKLAQHKFGFEEEDDYPVNEFDFTTIDESMINREIGAYMVVAQLEYNERKGTENKEDPWAIVWAQSLRLFIDLGKKINSSEKTYVYFG